MVDGPVIIAHLRWICPNRRKQSLILPLPTSRLIFFGFCYRRASWADDEPEDVVNAMQASIWGGEFF